jgi:hypothetical protein
MFYKCIKGRFASSETIKHCAILMVIKSKHNSLDNLVVNHYSILAFPYFFTGALFSFDVGRYVLLS